MTGETPTDDLMCYACGPRNPVGLHLQFGTREDGRFGTEFTPDRVHQGYKGIVHGGFLALVMDETMVAHLFHEGIHAVSSELTVRLLRPVSPGERLVVTARHEDEPGRRVVAHAETHRAADGTLVARAEAVCLRVRDGEAFHAAGHARAG
jgi:acyl-coenzyme A thioesterase PaaI-like protein